MAEEEKQALHKKLGIDLFNLVWTFLEKSDRTQQDNDTMLNAAHASRYHWGEAGTPLNFARGEWQISRVYSVLGRTEPALYHAGRCLELCQQNNFGDFDLAYAYEALARAYAVAGQADERDRNLKLAQQAGEQIAEEDDKQLFLSDIATVPGSQ